jgi:beta-mannosidase
MKSLDEVDRQSFKAAMSPVEKMGKKISLIKGMHLAVPEKSRFSLNGIWQMAMEGTEKNRVQDDRWKDAVQANIPCGVHTALHKAGIIPDPCIGENQIIAREYSYKTWWFKKEFDFSPKAGAIYILDFSGVADACSVWLNGKRIAENKGMFTGPRTDISKNLRLKNILVVKTEPVPFLQAPNSEHSSNKANNWSWSRSVVINNVYGWHYSNLPSVGIWQPVYIEEEQPIELDTPFIFTRDAVNGAMSLKTPITSKIGTRGILHFSVSPLNFAGDSFAYSEELVLKSGKNDIHYEFSIPNPGLWWPADMGEQNLYLLEVSLSAGEITDTYRHEFGIRTVEMAPLPNGPAEDLYNWTFIINGKKTFIKGTGWCTPDALLDLSRDRYERFIRLARDQHCMMMRAWGCGLPEKDDFYELCDKYGIMIMQEWPTAWDSHNTQPYDILEKTVKVHTIRLRNYPALIMYGAGNESPNPFGKAIDMMGRLSIELDGTRPYHRGEPWGGSRHDYASHWSRMHVDAHLVSEAAFWGEFGTPSIPVMESFKKYMTREDMTAFPLAANKSFIYHTPIFGHAQDISRILQFAGMFLRKNYNWKELIAASQLVQALVFQRVLERSRTRYPECSGALYYKMNDNFPAASWSVVDWYGAQKFAYYSTQDVFEPVHPVILFDRLNFYGQPVSLPVHLCDELGKLADKKWEVNVRSYDGNLKKIKEVKFTKFSKPDSSFLGSFDLEAEQTVTEPLFVISDVRIEGKLKSRSVYFSNIEGNRGCLFNLPRTSLAIKNGKHAIKIKNIGMLPAYGVWLFVPGYSEKVFYSDNFLWMEPGESAEVKVENADPSLVEVEAFNTINF